MRPNAFVSIRISSPEIRANVERVQQEMQHMDRQLRSAMFPLDKLHLTLMVLKLDNCEKEERCVYIINCECSFFFLTCLSSKIKYYMKLSLKFFSPCNTGLNSCITGTLHENYWGTM